MAGVALKIKASQTLIDWRLSGLPWWATESEKEKRATEKQKKGGKRRKEVIKMEGCRGFADVEGRMEEMVAVRILNMLSYLTA